MNHVKSARSNCRMPIICRFVFSTDNVKFVVEITMEVIFYG